MRTSSGLAIISAALITLSCVIEKAQRIQDNTQASASYTATIKSNDVPQCPTKEIQNKEWLSYEPAVVELKGKLTTKMYYGPPNYGEEPKTDSKEELPILVLSKPANVRGNPDSDAGPDRLSVKHARKMELVLRMPHKDLLGKNVIVKGTLFHAFTGHHHTDVLMNVESISLAAPQ